MLHVDIVRTNAPRNTRERVAYVASDDQRMLHSLGAVIESTGLRISEPHDNDACPFATEVDSS